MNTILAVDLGKFKSVCCFFNPDDGEVRYVTVESTPALIGLLLEKSKAEGVVRISRRGRLQELHAARNQDGGPGQLHALVRL